MKLIRRTIILLVCLTVLTIFTNSCGTSGPQKAVIETEFGNMTLELYDSTPGHRDNFIKLVKEGFYDDLLFHRIIKGFMIQGGDPDSRGAAPGQRLGSGGPGYTIPHEIGAPHIKGTLAAARTPNPEKNSSGSQFYITHGNPQSDAALDRVEAKWGFKYNAAQREKYKTLGGSPNLDMDYTVYGEVIEGLDVIDKIVSVQKDGGDRPLQDVKMKIRLVD